MRIMVVGIGCILALAGCATTTYHATTVAELPRTPRTERFVEADYAPYAGDGSSTIKGQAFARTRGGDVKYAAGVEIALRPQTAYSREWYENLTAGGSSRMVLADPDPASEAYTRKTRGDGEGRFSFEGIPAGRYFLTCMIIWEVPSGMLSIPTIPTWGLANTEAVVDSGKTINVVLTP